MKFKELTPEEVAKLDDSAQVGYFVQKNNADKEALEALIGSKATEESINAFKDEISADRTKQAEVVDRLFEAIKTQGEQLQKFASEDKETFTNTIKKGLSENKDSLQKLKDGSKSAAFNFDTKVVGDMSIAGNVTGQIPQAQREPGMNRIADRQRFVANWITIGVASSNLIEWVEQTGREGAVGGTAENVLKNQIDFDMVLGSCAVVKRTGFIKVTTEMLDDTDFIESEIRTELDTLLGLDIDNQMLQGDGIAPNLNGLITQATTFAAGGFALAVDNANNWDVLVVANDQIIQAEFFPSVVFMNPTDVALMMMTKATDAQYVNPVFQSAMGLQVLGIPIVANTGVPVGDFLMMDGSKATAFIREQMNISVGLDGNDFTENRVTFVIEWRGCLRIKGNDTGAFVTGTFATAKAALETP